MARTRLRIGKIAYMNLFPIFHVLERMAGSEDYEFHESYPSALNDMLRSGSLDLSPSSSIEYLRDKDAYSFIEGHSISAAGPIGSILLFSRVPIESLEGHAVYATHQSETSVALLKVILHKFHGLSCRVLTSTMPFEKAIETHSAYLSIGDEALFAMGMARIIPGPRPGAETGDSRRQGCVMVNFGFQAFYVYDLAELWHMRTGLPFVFALWIGRRGLDEAKQALVERFRRDLDTARAIALGDLDNLARFAQSPLPAASIVRFWRGIDYGLGPSCLEGLALFEGHLRELGLI